MDKKNAVFFTVLSIVIMIAAFRIIDSQHADLPPQDEPATVTATYLAQSSPKVIPLYNPLTHQNGYCDYSLYDLNHSLGFITRGCINKCPWCIVPEKEGTIRACADLSEFVRHPDVVLMDNNILAHPHGVRQLEKAAQLDLRLDSTGGVDLLSPCRCCIYYAERG